MLLDSDQDGVKITSHFVNSEEGCTYTYNLHSHSTHSELLSMSDVSCKNPKAIDVVVILFIYSSKV